MKLDKNLKKDLQINEITKILTVEASGIGIACIVAQYFGNVPVVFAKNMKQLIWIVIHMKLMCSPLQKIRIIK